MNNPESELITMTRTDFEEEKKKSYDDGFRAGYLEGCKDCQDEIVRGFEGYLSWDSMSRAQRMDAIRRERVAENFARHKGKRFL